MQTAPDVVIAGHVCIDEIVSVSGTARMPGSPATFMAPVLEGAGLTVAVAAPHGTDFDGMGTGLRLLDPPRGDRSLVYVNDVRSARRRQAVRNVDAAVLDRPSPEVLAALAGCRVLVLTPLLPVPVPTLAELADSARPGALRILLVQGLLRGLRPPATITEPRDAARVVPREAPEIDVALPFVDLAVLSEEDLGSPARAHAVVEQWSAAHPTTAIVVTRGADGASAYLDGIRRDAPAHPIVDVPAAALVGAGDVFGAELVLALLEAVPTASALDASALREATRRANEATAAVLAERAGVGGPVDRG